MSEETGSKASQKAASVSEGSQDNSGDTNKTAVECVKSSETSIEIDNSTGAVNLRRTSDDFIFLDAAPVNEDRVAEIMAAIRKNHYNPAKIVDKMGFVGDCRDLFKKDYHVVMVPNRGGEICSNYPLELVIPVGLKTEDEREVEFDKEKYIELANLTCVIRCRSRFIVPVIFLDNKFICRSGTVGNTATAVYETLKKQAPPETEYVAEGMCAVGQQKLKKFLANIIDGISNYNILDATRMLWKENEMSKRMTKDAELLDFLKVENICDLMVETEKQAVKRLLTVSSSEKMNLDIYSRFKIQQMPFPGCEFFKQYYNAGRNPKGLVFNWTAPNVNVEFKLSEDAKEYFQDMDSNKQKEWDLIELTKAYMKVLLTLVAKDTGSLLVHCISGWDRTPLFISLIRISLWADGAIHKNLKAIEMAFLTLAYDWYLFGHPFPDRYSKHEEVMHFCFNFLQYMADDEFSVTRIFHELSSEQTDKRLFPDCRPGERRGKIIEIGSLLLRMYDREILRHAPLLLSDALRKEALEITSIVTDMMGQ